MNIGNISIDRPVLASVISGLLVMLGTTRATYSIACDCGPTPNVLTAVKSAQLVIHGKIIRAEFKKAMNQDADLLDSLSTAQQRRLFGPRYVNEYTVLVFQGFKGASVNDTIIIRTGLDPVTDCGLILSIGSEYLIYAKSVFVDHQFLSSDDQGADAYSTSLCTRTRSFSKREARAIAKAVAVSEKVQYRDSY